MMASGLLPALLNHLWQSTAVALAAWLLTRALRHNSARVRYAVWLLASIKFLLPFQLLAYAGSLLSRPRPSDGAHVYTVIEEVTRPIRQAPIAVPVLNSPASSPHSFSLLFAVIATVWLCGFIVLLVRWISGFRTALHMARSAKELTSGREFNALLQAQTRANLHSRIPLLLSSAGLEPGIFGTLRPVLLWPTGLSNRLGDAQIEAIMAHEIEHVRRHDNLTSAIHSFIEALFWFHPLVRWMSARLSEERERACDERVLEQNSQREAYADSILKVCSFCMERPAACVSGVSGADLKQRILRIMTQHSAAALGATRKSLLSATGVLLIAAPVGFGVLHGQSSPQAPSDIVQGPPAAAELPKYEVATIKPSSEEDGRIRMMLTPDGAELNGVQVALLLQQAFGVERDRISGVPDWARSKRYDISAKVAPEDAPKLDKLKMEERRVMMLPLLEERFGLKYHHETRELPIYSLVVAKNGPKLKESALPAGPPPNAPPPDGEKRTARFPGGPGGQGMMRISPGTIEANGGGIAFLVHALSNLVGRSVVDKTGLTGNYDFSLKWTPDESSMPRLGPDGGGAPPMADAPADPNGPTLFTALEEQLGLKLESQKGKVDVIVIDHIDPPSDN